MEMKNRSKSIQAQVSQPEVSVPVRAGDPAGEVSYYYQDRLLFTLPLVFQYGLEADPTPTPAPVLQVEQRSQPSDGESPAPVQEIAEMPQDQDQPSAGLLWYAMPPLWLIGCVFVIVLLRRRKRRWLKTKKQTQHRFFGGAVSLSKNLLTS